MAYFHSTNHSAVLMRHKSAHSDSDFLKLFDESFMESGGEPIISRDDFRISTFHYKTDFEYTSKDNWEKDDVDTNGRYIYGFYRFSFKLGTEKFSILAFPWLKMGDHIFEKLKSERGLNGLQNILEFYKCDLKQAIKWLEKPDEAVKVASLTMAIGGETEIDKVVVNGKNPLYSNVFSKMKDITYSPKQFQLIYPQTEARPLRVLFDDLGSFSFRVGAGRADYSNVHLGYLPDLLKLFDRKGFLHEIDEGYNPIDLKLKKVELSTDTSLEAK